MTLSPILITGAAGFIGFHTAQALLCEGQPVVGIDNLNDYYDVTLKQARLGQLQQNPLFSFHQIDIADRDSMETLWRESGPFVRVIHLAAQAGVRYSLTNPYAYIHSNCMGHITVLEMCRHTQNFEHLVYASSSSVYGANQKIPFAVDDRVDSPVSLYAATKRSDELMSNAYAHLYQLPQTGLRFFTVYGPWGRPDMALYIFTQAIAAGKPVPVFNGGDMQRDFTYIDDIVKGVISALNHPPQKSSEHICHKIYNLGNTRSEKLMDFLAIIERELGQKANIDLQPMQAGDVKQTYADITTTTRDIGYVPTTTIEQGIPRFVRWYKEYYGLT